MYCCCKISDVDVNSVENVKTRNVNCVRCPFRDVGNSVEVSNLL